MCEGEVITSRCNPARPEGISDYSTRSGKLPGCEDQRGGFAGCVSRRAALLLTRPPHWRVGEGKDRWWSAGGEEWVPAGPVGPQQSVCGVQDLGAPERAWWYTPRLLAIQEADAGGFDPRNPRLAWVIK